MMEYPTAEQVIAAVGVELSSCARFSKAQRLVFPINPVDVLTPTGRPGRSAEPIENVKQLSALLIYQHVLAFDCLGNCERQYKSNELATIFGIHTTAAKRLRVRACEIMASDPEVLRAYEAARLRLRAEGFRLFNDHKAFNPCT